MKFDGFALFVLIIFLLPICGIMFKLISSFYENEAIKEILGQERYDWVLQQYSEKRRLKNKKEAKLIDFIVLVKNKIVKFKYITAFKKYVILPIKFEKS